MQTQIDASRPRCTTLPSAPRKRGPPAALRIHTPAYNNQVSLVNGDTSSATSALSSATSDCSDSFPFPQTNKPRSLRNMKRLSLTIPSAESSTHSLTLSPPESKPGPMSAHPDATPAARRRRPSVVSLPTSSTAALYRKEEDGEGEPSAPYADGPIEILPQIWLGSEDNARDWKCLLERGIKSILNVAKEISSPFDAASAQPRRPFASTPNLNQVPKSTNSTYYPPHVPSGRPGMNYLRLPWSHGQTDLVHTGFPEAMSYVDQALKRGDGVLIHCQCGVSRSATLVIALVMRAAALASPSVPEEVRDLKGMQGAYSYVKSKSRWVGPNMSLIYQLLDYERTLKGGSSSPASSERSSSAAEEEEWGRRRAMLDDTPSDHEDDQENSEVMREARALDKAMEDRLIARKASASSMSSHGMGAAWKNKYGSRKRTGSIASNQTGGSILSEDLVEEEEEEELLGVGGGFDTRSQRTRSSWSSEPAEEYVQGPSDESPEPVTFTDPFGSLTARTPSTARPWLPPPSAPHTKSTFTLPPVPATASKSSFDLPPASSSNSKFKIKRRPPPLGILPPVPSSPEAASQPSSSLPARTRKDRHRPAPPPLHLRNSHTQLAVDAAHPPFTTPSQTLFVFPPSPTLTTRTPSTMTLTSNPTNAFPFPSVSTPRVSTIRRYGKTKSFIGLAIPPTPTTASSRVDARGWVGISKD